MRHSAALSKTNGLIMDHPRCGKRSKSLLKKLFAQIAGAADHHGNSSKRSTAYLLRPLCCQDVPCTMTTETICGRSSIMVYAQHPKRPLLQIQAMQVKIDPSISPKMQAFFPRLLTMIFGKPYRSRIVAPQLHSA